MDHRIQKIHNVQAKKINMQTPVHAALQVVLFRQEQMYKTDHIHTRSVMFSSFRIGTLT